MSQLNSLLESANPYKSLQDDAARLATKWSKTGLLEGLEDSNRSNMSMLLENQAKQLVTEASNTGGGAGSGTFTAGTGAQWAGVALPLVRKVFGQIAAKEFVSVQPMNLPSGLVFYLDFQYGTSKSPFSSGNSMYGATSANFGNTNTGALYGAGRYSYSVNSTSSADAAAVVTTASWDDMNYDGNVSSSLGGDTWKLIAVDANTATGPLGANFDGNAARSFQIFQGSTNITNYPAYTKYDSTTNKIYFVVKNSDLTGAGAATMNIPISFSLAPTDAKRGDFEEGNSNLNINNNNPISIPQINVQLRSEAIVAKTRKLKAVWTPEFAQDLNAYHSLDAEAELTSIMSEYISLEIDLEILDMLIENAAAGTEIWSAKNNQSIAGSTSGGTQSDLGFYNSQGQWFQTLGTKIQKLSNIIHQKTLRGGANFLVCSPTIGTILESIPGFAANTDGDASKMNYAFGVQKVGQLNGRYQVYKNPYMTENQILLGFRGSQFLEAGAVFAPYVPLIMTPMVYDPDTFTPRKGLLTRYAKKMLRPEFYGLIQVAALDTI
jgi:hypothetical protein